MGFDKKILDLSRTIYQKSVMVHGSKENPKEHIENIRGMIREFIRTEVVPYELTNQEKMSFILKNEFKIPHPEGDLIIKVPVDTLTSEKPLRIRGKGYYVENGRGDLIARIHVNRALSKLTEEDKSALNTDLDSLRKAHSEKDVEAIDEASNKLNETWSSISTKLYQQSESTTEPEATNESGNDEVQDADFEEVK